MVLVIRLRTSSGREKVLWGNVWISENAGFVILSFIWLSIFSFFFLCSEIAVKKVANQQRYLHRYLLFAIYPSVGQICNIFISVHRFTQV